MPDNPSVGQGFQLHLQPGQEPWTLCQVHALSQAAIFKEAGEVICGVYCEWIANNIEAEV